MLEKAEPVKDPEYKKEMLKRKKTLQYYYRERDPGGEVLKKNIRRRTSPSVY